MMALEMARQNRVQGKAMYDHAPYIKTLDSLIDKYGDLPEAAEIAIERYRYMNEHTDATAEQKWNFTEEAIKRWSDYRRINMLRNAQMEMTIRQFRATMEPRVGLPDKAHRPADDAHLSGKGQRYQPTGSWQREGLQETEVTDDGTA